MKTRYEFIHFIENSIKGQKTSRWECTDNANGIFLGMVRWEGAWWKYNYFPADGTSYDNKCLRDIADFTENLTKELKTTWRKKKRN